MKPKLRGWLHFGAAPLSFVLGLGLLAVTPTVAERVAVAIYVFTTVMLFSVSASYHLGAGGPKVNAFLNRLDHANIYLFIAGSYTPFCLVTLHGPWGWSLFGIVWGMAVIGMLQEIKPRSEARIMSLAIYAVMGWVVIIAIKPLLERIDTAGFVWLAAGGLLYTIGIVFYAFDSRFRHWHGIWHLFVVGGSLAHYVAIAFYVI